MNPNTWEAETGEFKAYLVYRAISKTAKATQRNPFLIKNKPNQKRKIGNRETCAPTAMGHLFIHCSVKGS